MRVVIGTDEKSNFIRLYRKAFESAGHEVVTIANPHPFYPRDYTHDLGRPNWMYGNFRPDYPRVLESLRLRTATLFKRIRLLMLLHRYKSSLDLFVCIGDSFSSSGIWDFSLLRSKGKKICQLCYGGDVRCWEAFQQEYKMDISDITENCINNSQFNTQLIRLRKAEIYADAIFSIPDQSGLSIRPYHRLHIPFECERYRFSLKSNKIPLVVHIESRQPYKGERYIYPAVKQLQSEKLPFEFRSYKSLSHDEVINVLQTADILVDEVNIFGPGTLGVEAIACGCALATKVQVDSPIAPYICRIDRHELVSPLRDYIRNSAKRSVDVAAAYDILKSRFYPANVARDILSKMDIPPMDYSAHQYNPTFFINSYYLPKGHSVSEGNKRLNLRAIKVYREEAALQNLRSRALIP